MTTQQHAENEHRNSEFKINKPGVYEDHCGRSRMVVPIGGTQMPWYAICTGPVTDDGRCIVGERTNDDLVRYIGPLPGNRLQQIKEQLALAEEPPQ
jgi:hypothetical protein